MASLPRLSGQERFEDTIRSIAPSASEEDKQIIKIATDMFELSNKICKKASSLPRFLKLQILKSSADVAIFQLFCLTVLILDKLQNPDLRSCMLNWFFKTNHLDPHRLNATFNWYVHMLLTEAPSPTLHQEILQYTYRITDIETRNKLYKLIEEKYGLLPA